MTVPSAHVRACSGICRITCMVAICQSLVPEIYPHSKHGTGIRCWIACAENVISTPPILLSKYSLSFGLCWLSHLHFKCSQSQRRQFSSDVTVLQFPSPHLRRAVKASTFIMKVTCFPRWRRAVLAITSEGRPLFRHAARPRLTCTAECFCVRCSHFRRLEP